jgi:hypothetical protein
MNARMTPAKWRGSGRPPGPRALGASGVHGRLGCSGDVGTRAGRHRSATATARVSDVQEFHMHTSVARDASGRGDVQADTGARPGVDFCTRRTSA